MISDRLVRNIERLPTIYNKLKVEVVVVLRKSSMKNSSMNLYLFGILLAKSVQSSVLTHVIRLIKT